MIGSLVRRVFGGFSDVRSELVRPESGLLDPVKHLRTCPGLPEGPHGAITGLLCRAGARGARRAGGPLRLRGPVPRPAIWLRGALQKF